MARVARVVIPEYPHHLIQRGNRNQKVFFKPDDKKEYLHLLEEHFHKHKTKILSYCLMDNHVHLIAIPKNNEGLALPFGEANRLYCRMINFRKKWKGFLWQGRFHSYPIQTERYLLAAIKYVENNPVKAKLVGRPWDYAFSSAKTRVRCVTNSLVSNHPCLDEICNWKSFLEDEKHLLKSAVVNKHTQTGRPMGDEDFIKLIEETLKRKIAKRKPGPKGPWKHKN